MDPSSPQSSKRFLHFTQGWRLILLLVLAICTFLWLIKAPIMSSILSKKMGIRVSVRMISLWPKETSIRLFTVENPPGFKDVNALEVARTRIHYRWGALFHDPSEIDLITLDNMIVHIEIRNVSGSDNNWSAIGARMPERRGGPEVLVHKLVLKNMTVITDGPGAKILGVAGTQHFDAMEFDEIDSREGFPTKELIGQIFEKAGLRKYLQNFLNPTQRIKESLNPFNIFGKTPEEHSGESN